MGISSTTLKEWLSILEASFIIFKLHPYFENFGKRIIKAAKTLNTNFYKGIRYFQKVSPNAGQGYLIYAGELTPDIDSIKVRHFTRTCEIFE